jgi:LytS/YehU family sensor histidine kinase
MLSSIATPLVAFFFSLALSYAITRPIGNVRRLVGALLASLVLGGFVGVVGAGLYGSELGYEEATAISIAVALAGSCLGMVVAWRRRMLPLERNQVQSNGRRQSPRRSRYGISRA